MPDDEDSTPYEPCMEPVCMASTKDLIKEIRKRYSTGAFCLYHPTPQNKEEYKEWCEANQDSGFTVWPERYNRQDHSWGHRHLLLGLIIRLVQKIHDQIGEEERDIPEEEQY